ARAAGAAGCGGVAGRSARRADGRDAVGLRRTGRRTRDAPRRGRRRQDREREVRPRAALRLLRSVRHRPQVRSPRPVAGFGGGAVMLEGCVPTPSEFAERYRTAGYWRGERLGDLLRRWAEAGGEET